MKIPLPKMPLMEHVKQSPKTSVKSGEPACSTQNNIDNRPPAGQRTESAGKKSPGVDKLLEYLFAYTPCYISSLKIVIS